MNDEQTIPNITPEIKATLTINGAEIKRAVSYNNRLILETYEADRSLQSVERNGLAFVKQKVALVGLKLLVDARLNDGTTLRAGSTAYIKETLLHTQAFGKEKLESEAVPGQKFTIVDFQFVDMVVPA